MEYSIKILNILMNNNERYFSTKELSEKTKADRKTIYKSIADLERNGFGINVKKNHRDNLYKYSGLY